MHATPNPKTSRDRKKNHNNICQCDIPINEALRIIEIPKNERRPPLVIQHRNLEHEVLDSCNERYKSTIIPVDLCRKKKKKKDNSPIPHCLSSLSLSTWNGISRIELTTLKTHPAKLVKTKLGTRLDTWRDTLRNENKKNQTPRPFIAYPLSRFLNKIQVHTSKRTINAKHSKKASLA